MRVIPIVSGGLDSAVMLYGLRNVNADVPVVLSFDYGQRHRTELGFASRMCGTLELKHRIIDLSSLTPLLHGSALTDETVDVPLGHYEAPTMRATIVPNRNAMMLTIATAVAVAEKASEVHFAAHAGDHAIYPDCRSEFVNALTTAMRWANEGFVSQKFRIRAPFIRATKADIVRLGDKFGVPFEETWSCYQGGGLHCGKCGTCVERIEAFKLAGVTDPTKYEPDRVPA